MADFRPAFWRLKPYIAVSSVSHRLGSFGRKHFFAGVLFHKKDQKRDGENQNPNEIGIVDPQAGGRELYPEIPEIMESNLVLVLFPKVHSIPTCGHANMVFFIRRVKITQSRLAARIGLPVVPQVIDSYPGGEAHEQVH